MKYIIVLIIPFFLFSCFKWKDDLTNSALSSTWWVVKTNDQKVDSWNEQQNIDSIDANNNIIKNNTDNLWKNIWVNINSWNADIETNISSGEVIIQKKVVWVWTVQVVENNNTSATIQKDFTNVYSKQTSNFWSETSIKDDKVIQDLNIKSSSNTISSNWIKVETIDKTATKELPKPSIPWFYNPLPFPSK